jgi:hypothetical protein
MKLNLPVDLSNLTSQSDFIRYTSQSIKQIISLINGKVAINDNLDAVIISATFNSANTSVAVPHTLGRVPQGYVPITRTSAMIVFNGSQENKSDVIYLQASASGTVNLLIF